MRTHPIYILRITGVLDGISLLVLLGIAMPLKYIWGIGQAVTVVGSIHGGFSVYMHSPSFMLPFEFSGTCYGLQQL